MQKGLFFIVSVNNGIVAIFNFAPSVRNYLLLNDFFPPYCVNVNGDTLKITKSLNF